jgi:hypothetical protein
MRHPLSVSIALIVGVTAGAAGLKVLGPTSVDAQTPVKPLSLHAAAGFALSANAFVLIGNDGSSQVCQGPMNIGAPQIQCSVVPYR